MSSLSSVPAAAGLELITQWRKVSALGYLLDMDERGKVASDATHMAGRIALTVDEAEKAYHALVAAKEEYDKSPTGVAERARDLASRPMTRARTATRSRARSPRQDP